MVIQGDGQHSQHDLGCLFREAALDAAGINKSADDLDEVYIFNDGNGLSDTDFFLVNTSGKVIDSKSKSKDGNDYQYVVNSSGKITAVYVED